MNYNLIFLLFLYTVESKNIGDMNFWLCTINTVLFKDAQLYAPLHSTWKANGTLSHLMICLRFGDPFGEMVTCV